MNDIGEKIEAIISYFRYKALDTEYGTDEYEGFTDGYLYPEAEKNLYDSFKKNPI